MTQYPQPPQTCRLTVYGCQLEDGTEIEPNHNLEWRGDVQIRYCPDKDNLLKLYAGDSFMWQEVSCIEFLGRPDKAFSLSEAAKRGELPDILKGLDDGMDVDEVAEKVDQVIRFLFVMENETEKGGFTKEFLGKIGVDWPPPKGWKKQYISGQNANGLRPERSEGS